MKNIISIWLLICFGLTQASAQTITGSLLDRENGQPLIGVNVMLVGENRGTTTDIDGKFEIKNATEDQVTLRFSYIGFESFEVSRDLKSEGRDFGSLIMSPTDLRLSEVIISASPVASGVRYQAAQVFSGELLRQKTDMSLGLMLDGEPGVSMSSLGPAPTRPVIRGFDGERVLILQNGERMGDLSGTAHDHVVALEPFATDRIEIVRGPSSLLYGSSAIGGVVNLMTTDVPNYWGNGLEGRVSTQASSVNEMFGGFGKLSYGWDNTAVTGRLSYRTSGVMNTPEGKLSGTEMENLEGSLGFGFRSSNYQGGFAVMAMDMVYGIPEDFDNPDEFVEIRLNKQMGQARLSGELNGFFDKMEFRINGGRFFQQEIAAVAEDDGTVNEGIDLEFTQWAMSSTLTLQHKPFSIFDRGALGFNVYGRKLDVGGGDAFTPGDQNFNFAVFTFQEIPITSNLRLQAGLRGESWSLNALSNEFFPDIDESRSGINFSASTGLNYKPNKKTEMGFQLARAYRNPTLEELFAYGPHLGAGAFEIGNVDLDIELSYGSDAFISWSSDKFHIEAAAFYNFIDNYIIFQATGETDETSDLPVFEYLGDEAQMMGGELNLGYQLTPNLLATTGMDYVRGDRIGTLEDPLPFIPPLRWRSGLKWDTGRYWIAGDVRVVSSQDRVSMGEDPTPGYTLFNAEGGYKFDEDGKHSIVIKAQNIADKAYRDHLSRVRERGNPMPGRNLSLAYHFIF